ncbi:TPA: DUF805 domain-containing protein [Klebsiella aerogenes]|nr:DUF805 domain-containing protein [Klebsiella aerogenes]
MNKSITACYFEGWKKCFVYKGNATRKAFWSFILINTAFIFLSGILSYFWLTSLAEHGDGGMALVWMYYVYLPLRCLVLLLLLFPVMSLGIRRMHDIGKSGWWFGGAILFNLFLLPLVLMAVGYLPISGLLYLLPKNAAFWFFPALYILLNIISVGIPLWLCCKPTKIKAPDLPPEAVA